MSDERFLIVHGLGGSGPEHWQRWIEGRLRAAGADVAFPDLPDPDAPVLEPWLVALEESVRDFEPGVVLCHSLGSVLWLHLAARSRERLADRVLLVAPPSAGAGVEEIAGFVPPPLDPAALARAARETRMVCAPAGEDPYCPEGAATLYAEPLGLDADVIAGGGHLNTDAGYGPWPALEAWCFDPGRPLEANGLPTPTRSD